MGKDGQYAARVTATLTREQYEALERLAARHGVSMSWLVRRAVERLLAQSEGGPILPLAL